MKFSQFKMVTQVSLGPAVILIIMVSALGVSYLKLADVQSVANRISTLRTPTVDASSALEKYINVALADLRGWVLLKDPVFSRQRQAAWVSVRQAQRKLNGLSSGLTSPENVQRLDDINALLDRLEASQDKVERLAWSDKNLPATHLLLAQAAPRAELVFEQITKLMEVEQYVPTTVERKKLFSAMANFRSSFAIGLSHINAYLISAGPLLAEKFETSWQANEEAFEVIQQHRSLLDANQQKIYALMVSNREKFAPLPKVIFELKRKPNWNLANFELKSVTAPLGQELFELLEEMTQNHNRLLAIDTQTNESRLEEHLQLLAWIALLALAASIAVFILMKRNVGNPLNAVIEDAIKLSERVASGEYLFDIFVNPSSHASSYETSLLMASLEKMTAKLKLQAEELIEAKESSEFAAQDAMAAKNAAEAAKSELIEQKNAMDQHSLVSITDIKGTIRYANALFCEVSGYSQSELVGQNHRLLNSGKQPKDYWRKMYLKVSKGGYWHDKVCNVSKNGSHYWVDTTIVPNFDAMGKLSGYTSIRTNITKQQEIMQDLAQARDAAESASLSKAEFLANMSHEIRTPMNGVIGMSNLLLDTDLDGHQYKLAKAVKTSGNGLLGIINDILDFSKIEAGKLDLEYIDFDLVQMLESLGSTMAYQADKKGLQLICPATPVRHLWIKADVGRIRQVLTNLIGNAVKFTSQGEVAVFIYAEQTANGNQRLRFEIKDTGIGVATEKQAELFSEFTQADASTTRQYGGTGLGLSICKRLVELMGGEIGIESRLGQGSTFWIELEVETAKGYQGNDVGLDKALEQQKILIVDDNQTNLELMELLHQAWGLNHELAKSGAEALEMLQNAANKGVPFGIAILDLHMPGMDGIELAKTIQSQPAIQNTRLVMASSGGGRGDAGKMKLLGFKGYLTKPIHQSELLNILNQVALGGNSTKVLSDRRDSRLRRKFSGHVLVVEDNITNQTVIEGLLLRHGLMVGLANDGEEALAALKRTQYDLVFMDCQMPVMDGYTATKEIRDKSSKAVDRDVPIVAMTANAMAGDKQKCLDSGMDDYVSKPIVPAKIEEVLQKYLPEKEARLLVADKQVADEPEAANQADMVFDYKVLDELLLGDEESMRTISATFSNDLSKQIEELEVHSEAEDLEKVLAILHQIKGASANVGGVALSALALELESAGKLGDSDRLQQGVNDLGMAFQLLKMEMTERLTSQV